MKPISWLIYISLFLVLNGCSEKNEDSEPEPAPTAERTVLVYMAAENSLYSLYNSTAWVPPNSSLKVGSDSEELLEGAKNLSSSSNLLVFADVPNGNSVLYKYDRKGKHVVKDYGINLNSTDPSVLKMVASDAFLRYPSADYGLVMWSHASGWIPASKTRSFGEDKGGPLLQMNIPDMALALQGYKLDFILFDCCFMQCAEVAYDLRQVADYIIGSPCEIPGNGAYYNVVVPAMFQMSGGASLAKAICQAYYQPYNRDLQTDSRYYGAAVSALDCSQLDNFAAVTRQVLPEYQKNRPWDIDTLQMYLAYNVTDFWGNQIFSPYYDIKGEMRQLLSDEAYQYWKDALDRLIIDKAATSVFFSEYYNGRSVPLDLNKYSGLSGYIPTVFPESEKWDAMFYKTNWYKAAGWEEKGWGPES